MGGLVNQVLQTGTNLVGTALGLKKVAPPQAPNAPAPDPAVTTNAPGPAPDKATAQANIDAAAQAADQQDAERKKKGRASTVLTGEGGAGNPITASKTLLGD